MRRFVQALLLLCALSACTNHVPTDAIRFRDVHGRCSPDASRSKRGARADLVPTLMRAAAVAADPPQEPPPALERAIARQEAEIDWCYRSATVVDGPVAGDITVDFLVADGAVQGARVSRNTTNSSAMACCLTERMMQLDLPPTEGGAVLRRTFSFTLPPRLESYLALGQCTKLSAVAQPHPQTSDSRKAAIREVVVQNISAVRWCYESELALDPYARGQVVVRFMLTNDGAVSTAGLVRSELNGRVGCCIVNKVLGWHFPRHDGDPWLVEYPFVLLPEG